MKKMGKGWGKCFGLVLLLMGSASEARMSCDELDELAEALDDLAG